MALSSGNTCADILLEIENDLCESTYPIACSGSEFFLPKKIFRGCISYSFSSTTRFPEHPRARHFCIGQKSISIPTRQPFKIIVCWERCRIYVTRVDVTRSDSVACLWEGKHRKPTACHPSSIATPTLSNRPSTNAWGRAQKTLSRRWRKKSKILVDNLRTKSPKCRQSLNKVDFTTDVQLCFRKYGALRLFTSKSYSPSLATDIYCNNRHHLQPIWVRLAELGVRWPLVTE